jgi:YHS domain-containing protein
MKVKDPVCGMMIDPARAVAKGTYGGETVYFCAVACQKSYERTHPTKAA